jgi:hypothetical protein
MQSLIFNNSYMTYIWLVQQFPEFQILNRMSESYLVYLSASTIWNVRLYKVTLCPTTKSTGVKLILSGKYSRLGWFVSLDMNALQRSG